MKYDKQTSSTIIEKNCKFNLDGRCVTSDDTIQTGRSAEVFRQYF